MAVITGTFDSFFGITDPLGPVRDGASPANEIACGFLTFNVSGTYVQNDNAQLTNVPTSIQNSLRNGRTVTLLDAAFAAPGDEAGTAIGAKTVAVSGTSITMELTGADMTTEHAGAALGTLTRPICLFVTFQLSGN